MTPQELKNSILQLAIQGKLVEQRPEEGSAHVLYAQIQAEKQRLVKEGKIKKEKSLPEITEDEKPFEIPESWMWVRLRNIVYNRGQLTPQCTFSYIDIGSIDNQRQLLNADENIVEANKAPSRARKIVEQGDILYSTVRPYLHNMCIVDKQFSHKPIASTGFAVLTCHKNIFNKYLFYYLMTPAFDSYANSNENAKGVAYPAINDDRLYRAVIALPPLAEQKRIVAKIEELLPYLDRYEQAWSKLEQFNTRFPEDMKKSLLQYAIQGKLVEQRPEEGTAEELFEQIHAEKKQLIKGGKIKKERLLPEITEDEKPFEIPESWMWVRLGDICTIARGGSPRPIKEYLTTAEGGVNWIKIGDTEKNGKYISFTAEKIKPSGVPKSRMVYAGDFLLTNSMSFGRPYILKIDGCIHDGWLVISQANEVFYQDYLYWMLSSSYAYMQFCGKVSGAVVKNLNSDKVANSVFPLPPLAEQKRIAARLEELLPMCERLN